MGEDERIETPVEETEDSFLDGWDEEGGVMEEDAPAETGEALESAPDASPADTEEGVPTPAPQEEAPQEGPQDTPAPPQPRTWTLNHQGQPVTVGEADLAALAQRGLEYDSLRAEYDESRPIMELFRGFAADAGMEPRAYLNALRMQAMQARGMNQEDARRAVELEDREAAVKQQEAAEQARQAQIRQAQEQARNLEARRRAEVQEFLAVFPDAAKTELPGEVWDGVRQGLSLTASYARYQSKQTAEAARAAEETARQQAEIAKQNAANAARSTGSLRTAGANHGPKDPFLEGWEED